MSYCSFKRQNVQKSEILQNSNGIPQLNAESGMRFACLYISEFVTTATKFTI